MKNFLLFFVLLFPAFANAGAFSAVRSAPTVTSGVSGNQAIIQVAQPYTFTQTTAANTPIYAGAANAAQYSVGGGAGSPAANIAQAALGVGTVAAGVFASPAIGAAVGALTVGMAGYELFQNLKGQGITINADGSSSFLAPHPSASIVGAVWQWPIVMSIAQAGYVLETVCGVPIGTPSLSWNGSVCFIPATAPNPFPPVAPTPTTNQQFIDAINKATLDARLAADAVALAQSRNINPLAYVPSTQPNLNSAPYSVTLPDGTVVTVTPKTTLGGQDAISPAPTSTTTSPAPVPSSSTSPAPAPSKSLCETNPTASACADLGTAPATPALPTNTVDVSGTNFNNYLFSGSNTCPADVQKRLGNGTNLTVSYAPFCTFLSTFRPIALAVALFVAGLIMFGQRSTDSAA